VQISLVEEFLREYFNEVVAQMCSRDWMQTYWWIKGAKAQKQSARDGFDFGREIGGMRGWGK